jgi:hypothetical protein
MTKTFIYFLFASFFGTIEPVSGGVNLSRITAVAHKLARLPTVFRIA